MKTVTFFFPFFSFQLLSLSFIFLHSSVEFLNLSSGPCHRVWIIDSWNPPVPLSLTSVGSVVSLWVEIHVKKIQSFFRNFTPSYVIFLLVLNYLLYVLVHHKYLCKFLTKKLLPIPTPIFSV